MSFYDANTGNILCLGRKSIAINFGNNHILCSDHAIKKIEVGIPQAKWIDVTVDLTCLSEQYKYRNVEFTMQDLLEHDVGNEELLKVLYKKQKTEEEKLTKRESSTTINTLRKNKNETRRKQLH